MTRREILLQKAKASTRQEVLGTKEWLDVGMRPLSYEIYWGDDIQVLLQDERMTIEDTPAGIVITRHLPRGTPICPGEFKNEKFTTHDTVDIRRFSQRVEVVYEGPPPPPNVIKAAQAAKATHISPDGRFVYTTKKLDVHWADGTSTARWNDKEEKFGCWGSLPDGTSASQSPLGIPAGAVEISSLKEGEPVQAVLFGE